MHIFFNNTKRFWPFQYLPPIINPQFHLWTNFTKWPRIGLLLWSGCVILFWFWLENSCTSGFLFSNLFCRLSSTVATSSCYKKLDLLPCLSLWDEAKFNNINTDYTLVYLAEKVDYYFNYTVCKKCNQSVLISEEVYFR